MLGDTARLRNGLLDDKLSSRPADAWSAMTGANSQPTGSQFKAPNGALHADDECKKADETAISLHDTAGASN